VSFSRMPSGMITGLPENAEMTSNRTSLQAGG